VKSAARVFWTGFVLNNFKILAASPFMVMTAALGMGFAIDGERWSQTLSAVLATPANRGALFLGRAVPVLLNAAVTSATAFVAARFCSTSGRRGQRYRRSRCWSSSRRSLAPGSAC
jgi:ABC-type Na+ efflux pump permease subunit